MTDQSDKLFDPQAFAALQACFHLGAADASRALAKWVGKPSVVRMDALQQLPLEEATTLLQASESPVCFCSAELVGFLGGQMILVFDDSSGLAIADLLLDQTLGTTNQWSELATSAVLETTNILGCAYLNSLSENCRRPGNASALLPSPPTFHRDFAESLLQFALLGQAVASDLALVAQTDFEIDGAPINGTMLLIPDASSMSRLPELLLDDPQPQ
ncbi:MAG: chemotaxis protein CheC [Planctomycetota bacterium]